MFGSSTLNVNMSVSDILAIISTTTQNTYAYLNGILPTLMVFGVVIGMLFFGIRWLWALIRGHGHRP